MSLDIFVTEHFNSTDICEITHFFIKAFTLVIFITREGKKYMLKRCRIFCLHVLVRRNRCLMDNLNIINIILYYTGRWKTYIKMW